MAAKGYPGDYQKGTRIEGLDDAAKIEGVEIFHAGTVAKDGAILANGGRVLNVCASGKTVLEAQQRAYAGGRSHQMAGRFLPPRHRLAGGGAGAGDVATTRHSGRRATRVDPESRSWLAPVSLISDSPMCTCTL